MLIGALPVCASFEILKRWPTVGAMHHHGQVVLRLKTPWRGDGTTRQVMSPLGLVWPPIDWPLSGSQIHWSYVSTGSRAVGHFGDIDDRFSARH